MNTYITVNLRPLRPTLLCLHKALFYFPYSVRLLTDLNHIDNLLPTGSWSISHIYSFSVTSTKGISAPC